MEKLTAIPNLGKWFEIAEKLNNNLSLIENEIEKLGLSTYKCKGYFTSIQALESYFPIPRVGDWAIIDNYIYRASQDDNGWFWEEGSIFRINVDLSEYLRVDGDASDLTIDGLNIKDALDQKLSINSDISQSTYIGDKKLINVLNEKITSNNFLPFDGVTETTQSVIASSTASDNIFIYYSTVRGDFVAYNIEDDKLYSGFQSGFKNKTKYTRDGIYIDNDGNIYTFIDGVFTQIVGVGKHFTSHSKVNKAINELYIVSNNENYDVSDMYVAFICRKWKDSNNDLIKCQLQIKHADGTIVCQYGDYIADYTHEPPSIVELKENNGSGVSGYALVDWVAITEGYVWYQSNYEGKAILNKKYCTDINFSKSVNLYLLREIISTIIES